MTDPPDEREEYRRLQLHLTGLTRRIEGCTDGKQRESLEWLFTIDDIIHQ